MSPHAEAFLKLVDASRKKIKEFTVDEIAARLEQGDSFVLVDTREDREWDAGRIRGAIHLGKGVIERDIEAAVPDKNQEIVLYCGGGFRSALAADALQQMGYTQVSSMDGGIREWRSKNLPEEGKS